MKRLNLEKSNKKKKIYSRKTAKMVLKNIKKRIQEVNQNDEFIYKVNKAVLFGSYINSTKEKIGNLDIALYVELKNKVISEEEQNFKRARNSNSYVPFILRFIYGKEEVFKYIKNRKQILELHDGNKVDEDAKKLNVPNYIFFDKNEIIFEEVN